MGKVRPKYIKSLARRLLELYPDKFTSDFEHNKRMVSSLADIPSKRVRNQVAGFITHLVKMRESVKAGASEEVIEMSEG